jgi:hypothetical protein
MHFPQNMDVTLSEFIKSWHKALSKTDALEEESVVIPTDELSQDSSGWLNADGVNYATRGDGRRVIQLD